MKSNDLRKKSPEDLQKLLIESKGKLQQLRFDLAGGKVKNVKESRELRKTIARVETILKENK